MVGFLGPNGAGKSTTIKMLTGVLHPTSGEVDILGFTPWKHRKKYVRGIGAVFGQKSQLLWDIPPIDAFYMNKAIYSLEDEAFQETLDQLVRLLDVAEIIRKPTRQLSLGERVKCEFIMAMLHRPDVVFLDEPTIGLDVIAKERIRSFVQEMNRRGVTFILTTHDLEDIEQLARRVIVVNHGEIVFDDSIQALRGFLGAKKTVHLSTELAADWSGIEGVSVLKQDSPTEAELELDTDIMPLRGFISLVNERYTIRDMALNALPIERIIKELYEGA
ncbi:ATP-binding cassette domain-containing protein [Paenibacillus sp. D2_2]|uniref:ABC transporter ATP-binding protein n=1 Tax=Paenibacillus sp. D2_2 TaxID=3073092 RepID=UPI002815BE34|nr:ATP-binding cassette domain-containing protein [Paenibacillus sp. D2_2]WMT43572.1 ATP-binding cassette domain-containing protein [Paenibacillus sp. D2_2]